MKRAPSRSVRLKLHAVPRAQAPGVPGTSFTLSLGRKALAYQHRTRRKTPTLAQPQIQELNNAGMQNHGIQLSSMLLAIQCQENMITRLMSVTT
eukprot:5882596-Amphidinium_carterae.1